MSVADVNLKFEIDFGGHRLIVARPNFKTEGAFVDLIRQKAYASVEIIRDPATRKETLGTIAGEIASGKYDWDYDSSLGVVNHVHEALRTIAGIREWCFFVLRQSNPMFISDDGRSVFDDLWKDAEKRDELISKLMLFNAENPQMPPDTKGVRKTGEDKQ